MALGKIEPKCGSGQFNNHFTMFMCWRSAPFTCPLSIALRICTTHACACSGVSDKSCVGILLKWIKRTFREMRTLETEVAYLPCNPFCGALRHGKALQHALRTQKQYDERGAQEEHADDCQRRHRVVRHHSSVHEHAPARAQSVGDAGMGHLLFRAQVGGRIKDISDVACVLQLK
jgi:hypothetical protein